MNQRSITTAASFAVAAAMAISACGSDDGGLQAGDVDLVEDTADVSVSEADDVADAESTDAEAAAAVPTDEATGDAADPDAADPAVPDVEDDPEVPDVEDDPEVPDVEDDPDPVFQPFTEVVEGPFGSGEVSNATIEITDAVWSNRTPRDFEDESAEPDVEDTDERFLYLTVDIVNDDPNDTFQSNAESYTVIGENGPAIVAESTGFVAPLISPLTAQTRTLGFDLGEVVDAGTLTLRFADDAIPEFIDVIAPAAETPSAYPVDVSTPAPGEYIGSNTAGCDVPYTWTVDTATVFIDIPAEFDGNGASTNSRANIGQRWIRLTGSMSAGSQVDKPEALCGGNVNGSNLRLVVDGLGMEPLVAPNVSLGVDESVSLDLLWAIPADATELAIQGLGPNDSMFESPFTVPALPAVRGE